MGTIKTTNIEPIADNGTITLGSSGDTFTLGSGVTLNSNTPIFFGQLTSDQTVSSGVQTLVNINSVSFDTNSNWDSSAKKWTPNEAGTYLVYGSIRCTGSTNVELAMTAIYKNGAEVQECQIDFRTANGDPVNGGNTFACIPLSMNGTSDYVQLYGRNLGGTTFKGSTDNRTFLGAYKLGV